MRESLSESSTTRSRGDCASEGGPVDVASGAAASSILDDPARLSLPTLSPRALTNCAGASVTKCLWTMPRESARCWWPESPLVSSSDFIGAAAQSFAPLSAGAPLSAPTLAALGSPRQPAPTTIPPGARPLRPLAQWRAMLRPHNTTRSRAVGETLASLSTLGERRGGVPGETGHDCGLFPGDLRAARARARASPAISCGRRPRGNNCAMSQVSSPAGMASDLHSRECARNPQWHCGAHAAYRCPCHSLIAAKVRLS